MHFFVKLQAEI